MKKERLNKKQESYIKLIKARVDELRDIMLTAEAVCSLNEDKKLSEFLNKKQNELEKINIDLCKITVKNETKKKPEYKDSTDLSDEHIKKLKTVTNEEIKNAKAEKIDKIEFASLDNVEVSTETLKYPLHCRLSISKICNADCVYLRNGNVMILADSVISPNLFKKNSKDTKFDSVTKRNIEYNKKAKNNYEMSSFTKKDRVFKSNRVILLHNLTCSNISDAVKLITGRENEEDFSILKYNKKALTEVLKFNSLG